MALTQIKLGGLAAESVDSDAYVDGSIDLAHLSADSVDSTQYVDGSIDNAHLADDAVDSDELAAGSVDAAHLAAGVGGISHDGSTADGVLTYKDADEATVEANLTFDGTDLTVEAGDIVFGTAGKGICLGVTSNTDANTLDDYEEGTWTPIMNGGATALSAGVNNLGRYTKIGDMVTITGTVHWSGTAGGNVTITGIPFAANSTTNFRSAGAFGVTAGGITCTSGFTELALVLDANNSYIWLLQEDRTDTNSHDHTPTISENGSIYGITITYQV